jgi:hypothetical protein
MTRLIQMLFALIAYFCVATMISLTLGIGYLWQSDRLNDEKVFRMVALLQDVELHHPTETHTKSADEIPPEEPSLDALMQQRQIQDRDFEVKMLALQRGRQEYDDRLQQLAVQTVRYDRLAQEWQTRWKKQEELTTQENLAKVVSQLEQVKADQGKTLLMLWINDGRLDDVILLMNKMSKNKLSRILKTFDTQEELDKLHEIHQRILSSNGSPQLQQALDELNAIQPGS